MAFLETQFQELKENTNREITMLRQLIKVTWRTILEERQAFWEKQRIPKSYKPLPQETKSLITSTILSNLTSFLPLEELKESLLDQIKPLELIPRLNEDLHFSMRRISLCETQIDRCFKRCHNLALEMVQQPLTFEQNVSVIPVSLKYDPINQSSAITEEQISITNKLFDHHEEVRKAQSNLHRLPEDSFPSHHDRVSE